MPPELRNKSVPFIDKRTAMNKIAFSAAAALSLAFVGLSMSTSAQASGPFGARGFFPSSQERVFPGDAMRSIPRVRADRAEFRGHVRGGSGAAGDKLWECEHNYVYTSEGSGSDVYFDCASPR